MKRNLIWVIILLSLGVIACRTASIFTENATPTAIPSATPMPQIAVMPGETNPDEPVFITGDIPYTSPFFESILGESYVMLEDQAGFVRRDREFAFKLESQLLGPVSKQKDQLLNFSISLPAVPQGTFVDVDNDGGSDAGVQVFAVAFWSNTWDDPFIESREGKGWSNAYSSTITDPEREDEITGGTLVVWAPDDQQAFPSGFGDDKMLFTADDPTTGLPAGYSLVDLNEQPFRVYKEARPKLVLNEGSSGLKDYSSLSYSEAFKKMFDKVSIEYPFTLEKGLDWPALYEQFAPRIEAAKNRQDLYLVLRDFARAIPDGHVSLSEFDAQVFYEESGGGFGLVVTELSDGKVIFSKVLDGGPGAEAGIQPGAELVTWDGKPAAQAIEQTAAAFGPYSTEHTRRLNQAAFLTRVSPGSKIEISFRNPKASSAQQATLRAVPEYDSLFDAIPSLQQDLIAAPIEGEVLEGSGVGYLRINSFMGDSSLITRLWEHYIKAMIDQEVPALVIDLRVNGGGFGNLATAFASYFFDETIPLYSEYYYNALKGEFETLGEPARLEPAPAYYEGPVAVLIGPDCASACEGFAFAMSQEGRAKIVGHYPTAGMFGEVGLGQYKLPEDLPMQFPTGRPLSADGKVIIEGVGVVPTLQVPITTESALGEIDAVLEAAIQALLEALNR